MKITLNKVALLFMAILLPSLLVFTLINAASSLNPLGSPAATMKTLEDIYVRLTTGALAGSHTLNPIAGPAGTMHTLNDIYNAIPPGEWSTGSNDTWYGAEIYCSNWGGRLPTINELAGNISQQFTTGEVTRFSQNTTYWSSSDNGASAYALAHDGNTTLYYYGLDKVSTEIRYFCIR